MTSSDSADNELISRVVRIIASQDDKIDASQVKPETTLNGLGFDSFGLVNLMFALEDEFKIDIPDDLLGNVKTVGDVVAGLRKLRKAGAAT